MEYANFSAKISYFACKIYLSPAYRDVHSMPSLPITENREPSKKINSMYLTTEKKAELFEKYGKDAKNTGSAESQIALFTFRIQHLTEHLKLNRKDFGTERALNALVGKRRRMLDYLKAKDIERYRAIIKELGIRK